MKKEWTKAFSHTSRSDMDKTNIKLVKVWE